MKIRILQSIAGHASVEHRLADFSFAPGTVVDLGDALATAWVASRIALRASKSDALTVPIEVYTLAEDDARVVEHLAALAAIEKAAADKAAAEQAEAEKAAADTATQLTLEPAEGN